MIQELRAESVTARDKDGNVVPLSSPLDKWLTVVVRESVLADDLVEVVAGTFPGVVRGLTVAAVPLFRGWLDVRWTRRSDADRYEYRLTYEGGQPEAAQDAGNTAWIRIPAQPQTPVDVQVRAVNASGAGAWSPPVQGVAGAIDGIPPGDWGRLDITADELVWVIPHDRSGWGLLDVTADPLTWLRSRPPSVDGWGVLDITADALVWTSRRAVRTEGWGQLSIDANVLVWSRQRPLRVDGWGRLDVTADALVWLKRPPERAMGWGRLDVTADALVWTKSVPATVDGWGTLDITADELVWRSASAVRAEGWGVLDITADELTWSVS